MADSRLTQLADHIDEVLLAIGAFDTDPGFEIHPHSVCAYEDAVMSAEVGPGGRWEGGYSRMAAQMAWMLLEAAAGYLAGTSAILRCDTPMFAITPVIRSMFEAMGQAAWLLDPAVPGVRARAARVWLQLHDEVKRSESLARSVGDGDGARAFRTAKRDQARELAARFMPTEVTEPRPQAGIPRTVCGEQFPGLRRCMVFMESVHHQEWGAIGFYDYLAAAAHPNVLPILHTIVDRESLNRLNTDGTRGMTAIRPDQIDLSYLETLVSSALGALLDTWFLVAQYHGISTTELGSTHSYYPTG